MSLTVGKKPVGSKWVYIIKAIKLALLPRVIRKLKVLIHKDISPGTVLLDAS